MNAPRKPIAYLQNTAEAVTVGAPSLRQWVDGFFVAKRAEGLAVGTMQQVYIPRLNYFVAYCEGRNVTTLEAIDAGLLREYLLHLAENHNPGGCHIFYRVLKTFLLWYETEAAPDGWRNPIKRVPAPKLSEDVLEPAPLADVARMVNACQSAEGERDKAILLTLLDTGARASELCAFDLADLNAVTGELIIRRGKGGKARTVFLGQSARRSMRAYLRERRAKCEALFTTRTGTRVTYTALREIMRRRAQQAGVQTPALHSFRRACALSLLRSGADLLTIQRVLGHSDLSVLYRYAKQNTDDLRAAHNAASPVDKAGL